MALEPMGYTAKTVAGGAEILFNSDYTGRALTNQDMKYHPISDPKYFRNRNYIGKYWSRKFICSVQAVLDFTKREIGRGVNFFKEAFDCDVNELPLSS